MYFCPCCGYRTLYESPPGSYLVCPICFWEDTGEMWGIRKAQLNFLSIVLDKTERVLQTVPRSEYLNSITVEQLAATSQFLKFIIDYVPNSDRQEEAQESIEQLHKTNKQSI